MLHVDLPIDTQVTSE